MSSNIKKVIEKFITFAKPDTVVAPSLVQNHDNIFKFHSKTLSHHLRSLEHIIEICNNHFPKSTQQSKKYTQALACFEELTRTIRLNEEAILYGTVGLDTFSQNGIGSFISLFNELISDIYIGIVSSIDAVSTPLNHPFWDMVKWILSIKTELLKEVLEGPPDIPLPKKRRTEEISVLLIDDDPELNNLIVKQLNQINIKAISARDGLEALKILFHFGQHNPHNIIRQKVDVILLDFNMPNFTGPETASAIRSLEGIKQFTPIVALTGYNDPINQRQCMESGMNYFLTKPAGKDALKEVITRAMHEFPQVHPQ